MFIILYTIRFIVCFQDEEEDDDNAAHARGADHSDVMCRVGRWLRHWSDYLRYPHHERWVHAMHFATLNATIISM